MSVFATLLRQRLRRDRWQLIIWILGTAALAYVTYVGVSESYGTQQDRAALLATAIANPVIMLFRGLPSGADEGAFMLFLIFPFLAMMAAFMSSFLAVRHTRMDEELGRAELVAATPAGRTLPLVATVVHGILANLALAVLTSLALLATGLAAQGSLVAGFGAGAVGLSFLGVGLLAGQLMRTSRGANSLAVWVLLLTYLIGGLGNALGTPTADLQRIESSWLTWLSPFGWGRTPGRSPTTTCGRSCCASRSDSYWPECRSPCRPRATSARASSRNAAGVRKRPRPSRDRRRWSGV